MCKSVDHSRPTRTACERLARRLDSLGDRRLSLRARLVFPVTGPPLSNGVLTIQGGRIVDVDARSCTSAEELGNVALLPGLVNAHTHLEFSGLREPLGRSGVGLVDWIRAVIEYRRESAVTAAQAIERGLDESHTSGTTCLAEIAQPQWSAEPFCRARLDATVFLELIAPTASRVPAAMEAARHHLDAADTSSPWRAGLSPHAPYSVHPDLLAGAISLSSSRQVPLAMHLAESQAEIDWLRSGRGPFSEFLSRLDGWDSEAFPPGRRPLDYLRALAECHQAIVIHGNYLDDEEIAFLADQRERMAVVYCPRTHAYFGHVAHPVERLLAAGATVALGTDSRASTPDLSLLAEMRFAAQRHPALAPELVVKLATWFGARALGRESEIGSLEPGKRADMAIVALPDREASDPYDLLLNSDEPVVATLCSRR